LSRISVWAAWSEAAIWLYRRLPDSNDIQQTTIQRRMTPDLRYFLRLYPAPDNTLILRSSDERVTFLETTSDGQRLQQPPVVPAQLAALPCYRVKPLPNGIIAGINPDMIYRWQPEASLQIIEAPDGFVIRDVAVDDTGRLWLCGSAPTRRLKSVASRPAVAMLEDDGISWQVIERAVGGLKTAWQQLLYGNDQSYRTIAAVNGYLAVSAEIDTIDHRATLLFVRDPRGRWRSDALHDDVLRSVLPAAGGGLKVVTHFGQIISVDRRWRYDSLVDRLDSLIQAAIHLPAAVRYEIIDAQAAGHAIILVVSIRLVSEGDPARLGEAVVLLSDKGDQVVTLHSRDEPEIITASTLSRL